MRVVAHSSLWTLPQKLEPFKNLLVFGPWFHEFLLRHDLAFCVVRRLVKFARRGIGVFVPRCAKAKVLWVTHLLIVVVIQILSCIFCLYNWGAFGFVFGLLAVLGHLVANKVGVRGVFVAKFGEQVALELLFALGVVDRREAILDCPEQFLGAFVVLNFLLGADSLAIDLLFPVIILGHVELSSDQRFFQQHFEVFGFKFRRLFKSQDRRASFRVILFMTALEIKLSF